MNLEKSIYAANLNTIGVDEVGLGPLAGPLLFCAVKIQQPFSVEFLERLNDSKKLTAKKRQGLYDDLVTMPGFFYGLGACAAKKIDEMGAAASMDYAFNKCIETLNPKRSKIILDGSRHPKTGYTIETIVKGDTKEPHIAAASIIAKVTRDKMMADLAKHYPVYGWETNAGYGSQKHCQAILNHGLSPHHRLTYCQKLIGQGARPSAS